MAGGEPAQEAPKAASTEVREDAGIRTVGETGAIRTEGAERGSARPVEVRPPAPCLSWAANPMEA